MNIQTKIVLAFLPIVVITTLGLGAWSYVQARDALHAREFQELRLTVLDRVEDEIARRDRLLRSTGTDRIESYVATYKADALAAVTAAAKRRPNLRYVVLDTDGKVLTLGTDDGTDDTPNHGWRDVVTRAFDARGRVVVGYQDVGGQDRLYASRAYRPWGWVLVASMPEPATSPTVASIWQTALGVAVTASASGVLISGWLTRSTVVRPIQTLKETSAKIAGGEVVTEIPVGGRDELGELAREMEAMSLALDESRREARDATERMRLLIEQAPVSIAMFDRDMRYVGYSRRWLADYGMDGEDLTGRSHYEVFPEIPDRWKDIHRRCLAGAVERCDQDPFERDDGSVQWLRWEVRPWYATGAEIGGIVMFTETITEEVEAIAALRDSEERFRGAFEVAGQGIALVGLDGRWFKVNPTLCELVGYAEDELLAIDFQTITHPDDLGADLDLVGRLVAGEIPNYQVEIRYIHKDRSIVWILLSVSLVRDADGEPEYFVSQIVDLTARKRAEERLEKTTRKLAAANLDFKRSNQDLEQFAYVASHDLQEPLRAVSSYCDLLQKRYGEELDDRGRHYITQAVAGSRRMSDMINALLAFSRVRTRGGAFEPVDSGHLVDEALANLEGAIQTSGAMVRIATLPEIVADGPQVVRVFQNLIANAIKFCNSSAPTIDISAERRDGAWEFSVRDNGIGIDPEYAERIFVIFQRLQGRDEQSGSGIGLAICKRIVERHGGTIRVESEPDQGADFRFTIADAARPDAASPGMERGGA